jgi:hypothetical protein
MPRSLANIIRRERAVLRTETQDKDIDEYESRVDDRAQKAEEWIFYDNLYQTNECEGLLNGCRHPRQTPRGAPLDKDDPGHFYRLRGTCLFLCNCCMGQAHIAERADTADAWVNHGDK